MKSTKLDWVKESSDEALIKEHRKLTDRMADIYEFSDYAQRDLRRIEHEMLVRMFMRSRGNPDTPQCP